MEEKLQKLTFSFQEVLSKRKNFGYQVRIFLKS